MLHLLIPERTLADQHLLWSKVHHNLLVRLIQFRIPVQVVRVVWIVTRASLVRTVCVFKYQLLYILEVLRLVWQHAANLADGKLAGPSRCQPARVVEMTLDRVQQVIVVWVAQVLSRFVKSNSEHESRETRNKTRRKQDAAHEHDHQEALLLRDHMDIRLWWWFSHALFLGLI